MVVPQSLAARTERAMTRLEVARKVCPAERIAELRREKLPSDVLTMIARGENFPCATPAELAETKKALMTYWLAGNRMNRSLILEMETQFQGVPTESNGGYRLGTKGCVDARRWARGLRSHFTVSQIHETTAGIIVITGNVVRNVSEGGLVIEEGHHKCGGTKLAHEIHTGKRNREKESPTVQRISDNINHETAIMTDEDERDRQNARDQADKARGILREIGNTRRVLSTFMTWKDAETIGPRFDTLEGPKNEWESVIMAMITRETIDNLTLALEEGRNMNRHYAVAAAVHDPYELGRYNEPQAIVSELPNGLFGVTFDFARLELGQPLSRTGRASVDYAICHDGIGHVNGIGGQNGTRMIFAISSNAQRLRTVRSVLLSEEHRADATRNGETIMLGLYDPKTYELQFID